MVCSKEFCQLQENQKSDQEPILTKQTMKISLTTSQNICALAHNLKNAIAYTEAIMSQPEVPLSAKQDWLKPCINKLRWCVNMIDMRVPEDSRGQYNEQVRKADSLLRDNVLQLLDDSTQDQQAIIEDLIIAVRKGEIIRFETNE